MVSTGTTGLTNLALPLAMQALAGSAATGALTLSMTPYVVALSVQRGVLVQTYMRGIGDAVGLRRSLAAMYLSAMAITVLLVVIFGLDHIYLLSVAIVPLALYQDAFRYRVMGVGRASTAALSDAIWLIFSAVAGFVVVVASSTQPESGVILAFLIGAAASALLSWSLWPRHETTTAAYPPVLTLFAEGLTLSGIGALSQPVLVAFAGLEALGILRIAQLTVTLPTFALSTIQGAFLATLDLQNRVKVVRAARLTTVVLAALAVFTTGVCLVLPDALYRELDLAPRTFLLCVIIFQIGTVLGGYVTVMMWRARVITRVRRWLTVRIVGSLLELLGAVALGIVFGAPGVAAGLPLNNGIVGFLLYRDDARIRRRVIADSYTSDIERNHAPRE